jgi:hypothetical protein
LVLDQSTELSIDTLTEATTALTLSQGGVFLWVRDMPQGNATVVRTPRGQITITQPGHYVVLAGDTDHPTQITVLDGAGQLDGAGAVVQLQARQTVSITGASPYQTSVGPQLVPQFAAAEMARERPPVVVAAANAPPPVITQMTGGDALLAVGSWQASPEYGRVWYPPVQNDWVPYRDGHWAWVAPWGWTWVDNASWGFAPFHYGRWVQVGPRWGWIPEQPGVHAVERPVYAPALVTFIGVAAGVAAGAAFAHSVGWIPLGPREIYRPPYRTSDRYLRNVNVYNVRNVTNYRVTQTNVFVNRRAATMVPRDVMVRSERVGTHHQAVPQQVLASARPLAGRPVAPTRATIGVTPNVARSLNLPRPAPNAAPQRPPAPGPAFHPVQRANAPGRPEAPRPGQTQSNVPQPGRPDAARPDAARPAPGRAEPGKPQPDKPQPGPARPGMPQLARPDAGRPDANRPDANRPDANRPDANRPVPGQPPQARPNAGAPAPRPQQPPRPAAPDTVRPPVPAQPPHQGSVVPERVAPVRPQGAANTPAPRPAPHPQPAPTHIPQARPAPQQHPQPQGHAPAPRPAPQPQVHTPAPRPMPQPHAAPQPHPAPPQPRPQPHPAPQARPAPPQHHEAPRPAPQHRPEQPRQ